MKSSAPLTKDNFGKLLVWLSPNEQEAGEKYEQIRLGLIRFFRFRGCSEPEFLTDETISRVTLKISKLDLSRDVKKITIFYGFAINVYREYLRDIQVKEVEYKPELSISESGDISDKHENKLFASLEKCLEKLPSQKRNLLLDYFSKEKSEKIENRKRLARENQINVKTLHVKIHRIKATIKECIEKIIKNNM